jgi:hypothetical protein
LLVNSRIEYKCAVETPPAGILNMHRALRAVGHALGLTAPALVMLVSFAVGFKSTPTAFLHLIILVLPARAGGLIRAATALVTTRLVSR